VPFPSRSGYCLNSTVKHERRQGSRTRPTLSEVRAGNLGFPGHRTVSLHTPDTRPSPLVLFTNGLSNEPIQPFVGLFKSVAALGNRVIQNAKAGAGEIQKSSLVCAGQVNLYWRLCIRAEPLVRRQEIVASRGVPVYNRFAWAPGTVQLRRILLIPVRLTGREVMNVPGLRRGASRRT
jgi:hypothetical protein